MRPPIKKINFCRGQSVEISVKEDGFHGSYYEAKVVSQLDNGLYVVQYKTLLEDNEFQFLTETVYPKELRPLPPAIPVRRFSTNQKVDAFDNDGWWVGVITRKDGPDAYFVYFATTDQEIAYPLSQLRVHHDWIGGKWVLSKKEGRAFL
ncbi:protein AGENET DOMAIN (AGD)-CONTAINING P1-like [Prosopis cineraria]|uniref:protein AGENET DOMAIN (AGD)-CONTAINING P1-like n=1 Tax=Prosopis cineraria TaxID=364024 RepID=UPI00241042CF|nr:protein AGENET DOMAIN (AGD)-CONTAINING P1-like [Prosopis cineraria]